MKKKILVLTIFILILTGCGNDKILKCSFTDENSNSKMNTTQTFTFDKNGKNLKKFEVNTEYTYTEQYMNLISALGEKLEDKIDSKSICASYQNHEGISCNSKVDNNKIIINISGTYNESNKDDFKGTYDAVKETFVSRNYKCE